MNTLTYKAAYIPHLMIYSSDLRRNCGQRSIQVDYKMSFLVIYYIISCVGNIGIALSLWIPHLGWSIYSYFQRPHNWHFRKHSWLHILRDSSVNDQIA